MQKNENIGVRRDKKIVEEFNLIAEETGLTIGEIEEYMVRKGYRSKYST